MMPEHIVLPGEFHLLRDGPDVGEALPEDDEHPLGAAPQRRRRAVERCKVA